MAKEKSDMATVGLILNVPFDHGITVSLTTLA